ncbi:flagellar motor protein MotB [Pseudooceanicola onchidii]|uniref:flagellar motor protein MotB n=1 Tax=Pseudooceanicola onchidii TaxID=2562279 RepID=UPI0010AA34BD|nr:flagellar motor protein MotB [Pseudooceanicola onchidii]
MSAQSNAAPVIIKRKKVVGGDGHHGGAWKVAYADFVTAMMAFFLLMWLLNATTEKQRKGIADFFSPTIPVNRISGGGDGALGGDSVFSEDTMARNGVGATSMRATEQDKARGSSGSDADAEEKAAAEAQMLEAVDALLAGRSGESDVAEGLKKHIVTRVTDEGLVIELFDLPGEPLFDGSGAKATTLLEDLAAILTRVTGIVANPLAIEGHLAARPVVLTNAAIWETSAARANTFRELLQAQGMEGGRIARLTGHADREPVVRNPMAARNNRLEVIILRENI